MTHDPLCPFVSSKAEIYWRPKCPNCVLIARVREDARSAALRDAIAAVREAIGIEWNGKIFPKHEYDCCACRNYIVNDATNAIEALGGER